MPPKVTPIKPGTSSATRPTPSSNGRGPGGEPEGILAHGLDVSKLLDHWYKILIYGPNGAGKTTLACSFPKPIALISFEPNYTGGAMSVASPRYEGVKLFRIRYRKEADDEPNVFQGTASALALADALKTDSYFKTVVLDSATSYQDLFLQEILKLEKLPEQLNFGGVSSDAYRERSEKVKEGIRPFLNLKKHTVVLAKEKDHNPPKQETVNPRTGKVQPDMRPKSMRGLQQESYIAADVGTASALWLNDACTLISRLYMAPETHVLRTEVEVMGEKTVDESEVETGKYVHRLRVKYHPNYAARLQTPHPNCPDHIDSPTFEKIAALIRGESV